MPQHYLFDQIYNFRDIGGHPLAYGGFTQSGIIYRSAGLSYATHEDLEKLKKMGIKTIIDLRGDKEYNELPDKTMDDPFFHNLHLSVNGGGRVPIDADDMVDSYMEMVDEPNSARAIFKAIVEAEKPLLLHCTAGKDRTGVVVALLLAAAGVPKDDINADYLLSVAYLRAMVAATLEHHPDFPLACLFPRPEHMERFWREFNGKYGPVVAYFDSIGLNENEIDALTNMVRSAS